MSNRDQKITATQVALPKGGGAIQGIGETFQSMEFTGTAELSIPIATSPCRGFEPQLSIDYSSGAGNGIFGLGFSLSVPNIARKTSKAIPKYDDTDTFILSNADDLVPVDDLTQDGCEITTYRPRTEGLFAKIERLVNPDTGDCYWRTISKDNVTSIFGKTERARICDPENPSHVFQWLLEETYDAKGNHIIYEYKSENTDNVPDAIYEENRTQTANKYIERIKYGNNSPSLSEEEKKDATWHFEVVFDYGDYNITPEELTSETLLIPGKSHNRQDPFSTYHAGFEIRTHRLCRNILMFHRFQELDNDPILVQATHFEYDENPRVTRLKEVESIGYRYEGGEYQTKSLPPVEFKYTVFEPEISKFEPIAQENGPELPGLNLPPDYMSVDLYGEGIPGVLYSDGTTTQYWEAKGQQNGGAIEYAAPKQLLEFPSDRQVQGENRTLMDIAGDGRMALVVTGPGASGYYQYDPDRDTWQSWQPFAGFPTDFHHPHNQRVDVTGDGLMDILLVEGDRLRVYPSQGEKGFGIPLTQPQENDIPSPKLGYAEEALQFADIFGTGTQHLVRITNGKVECWPNLGYGKFGQKVQLENAPNFGKRMDASRLFLVDIDGSGTADIAYVYSDRVQVWFNQSGNSFSDPINIPLHFPSCSPPGRGQGWVGPRVGSDELIPWDNLKQINFADVLGNGTTGLVFSENHPQPRHWYCDLCGKQKPYLLKEINNNLGAISKITYTSSTQFYLQDKQRGTPWITKLPFPVQVVEKVEHIDLISKTRLVSCYSYHHGYYDRVEREFRGFGRVERQDAETLFVNAKSTDVPPVPPVPPVLTKTWYHTGAWLPNSSLSQQYKEEYFQGDGDAAPPREPIFNWGGHTANYEEFRQAHVALKGTVLRSEVYGLDKSKFEENPYSVSEVGYNVKLLQLQGQNKYAVFYVWQRETLSYDYERNPQDPRIAHHFTIEIDDYGNVLQDCAIAYGRRTTDKGYPEQNSLKATYAENCFVHIDEDNDVWLLGVPVESKHYELTNISLPPGKDYFEFEAIASLLEDLDETNPNLLDWTQHFYWDDTLQCFSTLGQVSPQMLLARSQVAVFSDAQIQEVFSGVSDLENDLEERGGYEFDSNSGYWWNPGLTQSYLGEDSFYLPANTQDSFGGETKVEYDSYHLLVTKVIDALANETEVEAIDYQTLRPQKIRDLNDNFSEVRFDALGMVILSSHYGTEDGEEVGFTQDLNEIPLPKEFEMNEAIGNPQEYLRCAASYFHYDLLAWKERQTPAHAVNLVAEDYPNQPEDYRNQPDVQVQTHITYNDGFGREVQTKMRVELGKAFSVKCDGTVEEIEKSEVRWLSSGGKVYNNKGNPVRVYEPYYIDTHEYTNNQTLNQFGVSSLLHYDPLQRVIKVDTPKGFFTKVEFTPWEEKHYDENDTVKDSPYYQNHIDDGGNCNLDPAECQALKKAAKFHNTPDIKILDNLGRTVRDVQQLEDSKQLETRYELDITGNQLSSADPRLLNSGIKNFETIYDLTNTALKTVSVDGGTHWTLHNVMGNPIYVRDSRNFEVKTEYDKLHRPTNVQVKGGDDVPLDNIVECIVYGETIPCAKDKNLRGQVYEHYDSAGLVKFESYSINGQPLVNQRKLRQDYKQEANWNQAEKKTAIECETYETSAKYDALGRVIEETDADGNIHYPTYNLSGSLKQLEVTHAGKCSKTTYVRSIDYNPKGQRTKIVYGNGVTTSYEYEATTFRLTRILTERENGEYKILQDLNYTYDPVGNITQIKDDAWKTIFNKNTRVGPVSKYTYDAIYRLTKATGREHPALSGCQERCADIPVDNLVSLPDLNNMEAVENYIRCYAYDDGGNLYRIKHCGSTFRTRKLTVSETSNRAVDRDLSSRPRNVDSFFDANGNQIKMVGIQQVKWNYRDNIASATIIERRCGENDAEYYVYDSSGSRIRKVTERYGSGGNMTHIEEVIYLGWVEIRRTKWDEKIVEERHCLRVMDDKNCIAVRNRWTKGNPPEKVQNTQLRYQLENHLGSATMEVDYEGKIISYEEYFPYGGTAFVAGQSLAEVKLKHYRYSGKERDGSTGLYYYGARYYAPWLGRWLSCDPAGTIDGLNLYGFVRENPINAVDLTGNSRTLLQRGEGQVRQLNKRINALKFLRSNWKKTQDNKADGGEERGKIRQKIQQKKRKLASTKKEMQRRLTQLFDQRPHYRFHVPGDPLNLMDRNIVFRGLDTGENPGRGLVATDQNADTTIRQHIAGQKPSPWISASKDEAVAAGKYFKERGYVAIDASQVPNADFVDTEQVLNELSQKGRHRNFVTSDQEVLFRGEIAADAILAYRSSDTEWQWTGRDQNPLEREYNVPPSLRGYSPLSPEYQVNLSSQNSQNIEFDDGFPSHLFPD